MIPEDGSDARLRADDRGSDALGKSDQFSLGAASKNTAPKQTLARGSANTLRKPAGTAAKRNGTGFATATPRKAKNARIATLNPNSPSTTKMPRQPNRSAITPEMEAPRRLPVKPTASSRPIATWR